MTDLPAPSGLHAESGHGQVTLRWEGVAGALFYEVSRADRARGPFVRLSPSLGRLPVLVQLVLRALLGGLPTHIAVGTRFVDSAVRPGRIYRYRVAASDGRRAGPASAPVAVSAAAAGDRRISLFIDAARPTGILTRPWEIAVNCDHLSYLVQGDLERRLPGAAAALREANLTLREDFGIRYLRAHGIFLDDLGSCRAAPDGSLVFDWRGIDAIYDMLLADGLKPFVELSFMPAALAAPGALRRRLFRYCAIAAPPRDFGQWAALVRDFATHLLARYGAAEVRSWYFEVWNEPDLHMRGMDFWRGSFADYLRLYAVTVRALKAVDPGLRVGGPVAALPGTVEPFLRHVAAERLPLDFLSVHLYASPLIDWRPVLARLGFAGVKVFYTEWGITGRAGDPVNDLPYGAAALAAILIASEGAADLAAYWESSDYDEEKPPRRFLHGGFGLLGLDGIRKPRYWAFELLHRLGEERLALVGEGDGWDGLVTGWATRSGRAVQALLANVTPNQRQAQGTARLDRSVALTVAGLPPGARYRLRHARIDAAHGNVRAAWEALGAPAWPDAGQLAALHQADGLAALEPERAFAADTRGAIALRFSLPMPGLSLVELLPED